MDIAKSLVNFESVNKKMERLKRKVEDLESKEADITKELEEAESSGLKKRKRVVDNWLGRVGNLKNEVRQREEKVRARGWVISNIAELFQNDVDRLVNEAAELFQNGNFTEGLTAEADESGGVSLLTTDLVGQDFETNKNTICAWLRRDESSIVGVYGLGGVGKTTLLTHINNQLLNLPGTSVYWVTASQHCSNSVLRNRIAEKVKLDLSVYGEEREKAAKLARTLGGRRGTVLILDDVWDCFTADELGFPIGVNGFKLILSTRSLELCRKMNCQYTIKVESLSDKEAWELFLEKLRRETSLPPQIEVIARSLVRNCDGLPLGIITMAGCMKGVDDICEWRNALEGMEQSKAAQEDMERVFRVLRYTYDNLKDPTVQQCFLYCSLFPEDHKIERDKLIEYLIDERLIDGRKSRQAKFDMGHTILNKLENVCLLEGEKFSWGKRYVKMHDLIRDMAIQITSTNPRFLVEAGVGLEDITDEIWSEDLVRVSLMGNPRLSLPSNASPRCPRLLTLLLNGNKMERIPDCFFMHMNELTVLNLSHNFNIKRLPCLEHLTALRRLDISGTGIAEVPQGIEKLVNLRYLDLEGTSIEKIPHLSKLCHLECLKLFRSRVEVRAEEVSSLRKLDYFSGAFYDTVEFNTYVSSWEDDRGPNSYQLVLGEWPNFVFEVGRDVYLTKCSISGKSLVLPKEVQLLFLSECDEVTCLCDVSLENAIHLKEYWIENCKGMKHLFCSSSCCRLPLLQTLQLLDLYYLHNLIDLMEGGTSITSTPSNCIFHSLKCFRVLQCHNMKRLFVHWLLPHLQNLERLSVEDCEQMEEIIGEASNEDEDQEATRIIVLDNLPNLKHLTLTKLPELKNFCSTSIVRPNSLEQICVWDCPKLRRMPLLCEEPNPLPSLQKIEVEEEWWESLQWDPPQTKDLYHPLCQFKHIN